MRVKVQLYVAGQVFTEEVRAVDYQEARQVALARNPNARVIASLLYFNGKRRQLPIFLSNQESDFASCKGRTTKWLGI